VKLAWRLLLLQLPAGQGQRELRLQNLALHCWQCHCFVLRQHVCLLRLLV
jgi:hypothetical protein